MEILNLDYYILFVFKDITNDEIFSTTDIKVLKDATTSEGFKIGDKIKIFESVLTIIDIQISNIKETLYDGFKYGWSDEGVTPQGDLKKALLRITITLE
ncbi:MAG: hypothetical protein Q4G18_11590 [Myroides sp.]|nr:hypothetical protein [Myroides sp.]